MQSMDGTNIGHQGFEIPLISDELDCYLFMGCVPGCTY